MAKQEKIQKKHLFGRNLFTFFFVLIGAILIFFMIYIPYSYISTKAKANPVPYETNVTDTMKTNVGVKVTSSSETTTTTSGSVTSTTTGAQMTDDAKVMKGSEFEDLNVVFYAETYDDLDSGTATFHLELQWNKNTGDMITSKKMTQLSTSGYTVYSYICLSAPWVLVDDKPFANYSSLQSYTIKAPNPDKVYASLKDTEKVFDASETYYVKNEKSAYVVKEVTSETFAELKDTLYTATPVYEGTSQSKTVSVSGLKNFPYKTKLWTETFPTRVSVDAPTAYVYIYFKYQDENSKIITKRYILSYEYKDYHTEKTKGGINYDK